jgi:hypothetical protein
MKMKKISATALLFFAFNAVGQSPSVTSWLQNTTINGSHYVQGNSTAIQDNVKANVQKVEYSSAWVYVTTHGIPVYTTGPFLDGNPSLASDQNAIFKLPLTPVQNTGTPTATQGGNIGIFINGTAMFDFRDGVAWNTTTNSLCGGPGNPPCPGGPTAILAWNRDAIIAEKAGFDCSKGHPAQGNYHHHQNPSAFDLDLTVISTICTLYDADGLYAIDNTVHSPLIGFVGDGFPVYGAYGFANADGTGGITRIKSSYQLRAITTRTVHADGTDVADGPAVSTTYPLGYFREDYEYIPHVGQADYLDSHNGRFCVTPEYPNGTYCYFATVDANWNSAYPYLVGPTYYGVASASKVTSITEPTTVYSSTAGITQSELDQLTIQLVPNPASEIVAIQVKGLVDEQLTVTLLDLSGKIIATQYIQPGSTITYFDTQTVYAGEYIVSIVSKNGVVNKKLMIVKD